MPQSSETSIVLPSGVDLHARPAAVFVKAAMGFNARIQVLAGDKVADGKSVLSILALGARGGTALRLRADGDDAGTALDALSGVVAAFE
jgi:phosphotransferase system HPr (HPr) family protein